MIIFDFEKIFMNSDYIQIFFRVTFFLGHTVLQLLRDKSKAEISNYIILYWGVYATYNSTLPGLSKLISISLFVQGEGGWGLRQQKIFEKNA